jgi:Fur family ferric uptake transcriptional regulator
MSSSYELGTVKVASSPRQRFEEFLQSRGKRMTRQRQLILEEVYRQHSHFNADELCDLLQKSHSGVSRPTVYRTLSEMENAGLLRKMTLGRIAVYEHDYGYPKHDHLYCEKCHKLIEFRSDDLERICSDVAQQNQFRAASHRLIVFGTCAQCVRVRRPPRKLELV